jgi:RNA polymerase sigma factor (sigma-70 family)
MLTETCCLPVAPALRNRLLRLSERTGDAAFVRLAEGLLPDGQAPRNRAELEDWIDTCAMDTFRRTRDDEAFSLLYERNSAPFLHAIHGYMRRGGPCAAADHDVLQEAFFAIYRYPHRFSAARGDAFRNWGHRIVRNTALRLLHADPRHRAMPTNDGETMDVVDDRERAPERVATDHESAEVVDRAYVLALAMYLQCFEKLSVRAKRVLTDVEVGNRPYRAIAADLGCPVANIKMAVFRARRAISRRMTRMLEAG